MSLSADLDALKLEDAVVTEPSQPGEAANSDLKTETREEVDRSSQVDLESICKGLLTLEYCRYCSTGFKFLLGNEWEVNVIVDPLKTPVYKAASYVWGETQMLPMDCKKCSKCVRFPVESYQKLVRLVSLSDKSGDNLWIDSVSIDQEDPFDITKQVAVMGTIYGNATSVGVLLPKSDKEGFELLVHIGSAAGEINKRRMEFSVNGSAPDHEDSLSVVCQRFFALMEEFERKIHKWNYWSRAWTFQEWALSRDFSIACEAGFDTVNLSNMKITILHAATLMSVYKIQQGQYATINLGFSRGEVPRRFESIKRLFPDELAFVPSSMVKEEDSSMDALIPNMRFGSLLGLRATRTGNRAMFERNPPVHEAFSLRPPPPASAEERFRLRLSMVFDAIGTSKREARYEADLICSWASMCNIKYDYSKNDTFANALRKVLKVLRKEHKLTIYNFNVNAVGACGDVDLRFLDYATSHRQCNATNKAYLHGAPVFTGRADTIIHFKNALTNGLASNPVGSSIVYLRRTKGCHVASKTALTEKTKVLQEFYKTISGVADGMLNTDVLKDVLSVLEKIPKGSRERFTFVLASIGLRVKDKPGAVMHAWAVCPLTPAALTNCFVARESLNGTLVLAQRDADSTIRVLAYLTITDQQCGTFLLPVDREGRLEITFKMRLRSDLLNSAMMGDRVLAGTLGLEEEELAAH